jgi:hypothetical protein
MCVLFLGFCLCFLRPGAGKFMGFGFGLWGLRGRKTEADRGTADPQKNALSQGSHLGLSSDLSQASAFVFVCRWAWCRRGVMFKDVERSFFGA